MSLLTLTVCFLKPDAQPVGQPSSYPTNSTIGRLNPLMPSRAHGNSTSHRAPPTAIPVADRPGGVPVPRSQSTAAQNSAVDTHIPERGYARSRPSVRLDAPSAVSLSANHRLRRPARVCASYPIRAIVHPPADAAPRSHSSDPAGPPAAQLAPSGARRKGDGDGDAVGPRRRAHWRRTHFELSFRTP